MIALRKFAAVTATALYACITSAQQAEVFPAGPLPYTLTGNGTPAVVFDAGFGDTRLSWTPVFADIAADTTAFAFDRPGYKASPEVVNPNDLAADGMTTLTEQAVHLHGLLAIADVAPPYVLVGHSLGAQTLLAFAKHYPDEVAGMVLVDGRLPGFTAACKAAGVETCSPPKQMLAKAPLYMRAEMEGALASENTDTASVAALRGIPVTLIVATEPPAGATPAMMQTQDVWRAEQLRYAQALPDARHVEATGVKHYIHRDQPALVIAEIRRMLERVRTGAWPAP